MRKAFVQIFGGKCFFVYVGFNVAMVLLLSVLVFFMIIMERRNGDINGNGVNNV